jgi:hypothetical protein
MMEHIGEFQCVPEHDPAIRCGKCDGLAETYLFHWQFIETGKSDYGGLWCYNCMRREGLIW